MWASSTKAPPGAVTITEAVGRAGMGLGTAGFWCCAHRQGQPSGALPGACCPRAHHGGGVPTPSAPATTCLLCPGWTRTGPRRLPGELGTGELGWAVAAALTAGLPPAVLLLEGEGDGRRGVQLHCEWRTAGLPWPGGVHPLAPTCLRGPRVAWACGGVRWVRPARRCWGVQLDSAHLSFSTP